MNWDALGSDSTRQTKSLPVNKQDNPQTETITIRYPCPSPTQSIGGDGWSSDSHRIPLHMRSKTLSSISSLLTKPYIPPTIMASPPLTQTLILSPSDHHLSAQLEPDQRYEEDEEEQLQQSYGSPIRSLSGESRVEGAWAHWTKLGQPKLIVAPMVDNSELPFRLLCRKYGADAAYTPMLHSRIFTENEKYRSQEFTTCKVYIYTYICSWFIYNYYTCLCVYIVMWCTATLICSMLMVLVVECITSYTCLYIYVCVCVLSNATFARNVHKKCMRYRVIIGEEWLHFNSLPNSEVTHHLVNNFCAHF